MTHHSSHPELVEGSQIKLKSICKMDKKLSLRKAFGIHFQEFSDSWLLTPKSSFRKKYHAFTLIEIMLAVAILALVFTAVTVSVRSKWRTEQARRCAQKIAVAWMRVRSHALKEGKEWLMIWDAKQSQLRAGPREMMEEGQIPEDSDSKIFNVELDPKIILLPDASDHELPEFRFLSNGRVSHMSILVQGPDHDVWRVKTDWSGTPVTEMVSAAASGKNDKPKEKKLPVLERNL